MVPPPDDQPTQTGSTSRINLALAFLALLLIGGNDGAVGVLIPTIRVFYHIDTVTISWFFVLSSLGYLSASFNNGLLIGRLGMRRFLLLALFLFLISAILLALSPFFAFYLSVAFLLGFSGAMLDAGLNTYVASLPNNATLLNYLHAFYGLGALVGPLVASSLLALRLGWQAVYITWSGTALLLFLGMWFVFTPPGEEGVAQLSHGQRENVFLRTLRLRSVWLAAFFLLFYVGAEVSLGSWSYSFLTLSRAGLPLFSAWAVSGYWCGLTLGRFILANVAARLGIRRLIVLCLIGILPGILVVWLLPFFWAAAVGLCWIGFCLGPLFPAAIALMPQLVPSRFVPSAIGFLASLGSTGGALFPWLAGNLAQHLGFGILLPYVFLLTLAMLLFWSILARQRAQI